MAVFDMIAAPPKDLYFQGHAINNRYFTVDTASLDTVEEWLDFNPHILTYAMLNNEVRGFINVIPLTMEAGMLFEQEALKEEDVSIDHILPHESLEFAQYAYIAAIAVRDTARYIDRQCAAALMATMADLLLHGYGEKYLRKIFVNPTTFQGNTLVHRLGLKPVDALNKVLKENDIYEAVVDAETRTHLAALSQRYRRFIGASDWAAAK